MLGTPVADLSDHLFEIRRHLKEIPKHEVPDDKLPDLVGQMNDIRALAQSTVGMLKSEATAGEGEMYRLVEDGSYKRSYNVQGLIKKRMDASPGMSPTDVLAEMYDAGMFGAPRWTQTQKWASQHDVTITVANHEVAEGDVEAEVGQVWDPKPLKVEAVPPKKGEVL